MGCGCRKTKNKDFKATPKALSPEQKKANRGKRIKRANTSLRQAKRTKKIVLKQRERSFLCNKCSHSIQTQIDKRHNLKICHKVNRPLSFIAKELSFECPIGSFSKISI